MRNDVSSVRPSDIIIKSTIVSIIYLPIRPSSPPPGEKEKSFPISEELKKSSDQVVSIYAAVHLYYNSFVERNKRPFYTNNASASDPPAKFAFRWSNVRPTVRNLLWGLAALFIITIPL